MRDLTTRPVKAVALPEEEAELARLSGDALTHFGGAEGRTLYLRLEDWQTGAQVEATVPGAVVRLLADALTQMAEGKAVTLMSLEAELSTQQAAERLGVSRPFFVKLLEQGEIPYRKVGEQRRVRGNDLAAYMETYRHRAHRALDDLAAEAQRLNLYE